MKEIHLHGGPVIKVGFGKTIKKTWRFFIFFKRGREKAILFKSFFLMNNNWSFTNMIITPSPRPSPLSAFISFA